MSSLCIMRSAALGSVVLLLAVLQPRDAQADGERHAVVTQGAFLLSEEAVVRIGKRRFHRLESYLPIGTIVAIDDQQETIFSRKTDQNDTYVAVRSELGSSGLLRQDLFVEFGERPIIVPIGPEKIQFYRKPYAREDKPTDCQTSPRCIFFSRNDDVHLEITDESRDDYYGVTMYRHRTDHDFPMEESGWVSRGRIDIDLKRIDAADASIGMASWRPVPARNEGMEEIAAKVGDKFEDQAAFMCRTSATLDADAGVRLFGAGIVLAVDATLKEQGKFRIVEDYAVDNGDDEQIYEVARDIVCDDAMPERMSQLTLEDTTAADQGFASTDQILLKDLADSNSPWILTLKGEDAYTRMIAVDSWEAYNETYKKLESFALNGDGYLSELDPTQQKLMLNFIIHQIAIFQHRKKDFAATE